MDFLQQLSFQLRTMLRLVDDRSDAILFRHSSLRGFQISWLRVTDARWNPPPTMMLYLEISDPTDMARLLADAVKMQLPIGI